MQVTITTVPGTVQTVTVYEGDTLRDALVASDYGNVPEGYTIKLNNRPANLDAELYDGDRISLSKNGAGGIR